jgi:hypothetical protein
MFPTHKFIVLRYLAVFYPHFPFLLVSCECVMWELIVFMPRGTAFYSIQGVSGGIVNISVGGSMDYSE